MKKQPYPIANLTGGLNVNIDPTLLTDIESPDIREVYFDKGLLKKDFGKQLFGGPILGTPMLLDTFYKLDGTTYLFCFTTQAAYIYNETSKEWEDVTIGVTVEDCEDVWVDKTNVTSSVSTTDFKRGTKSLLLTVATAFTTGIAATEVIDSADLHTFTHIHLWVKSSITLAADQLALLLDDTAACASPIETINFPALTAGVWTRVSLPLAHAADDIAIISVGINVNVDQVAFTLALDDIRAVKGFTGTEDNLFFSAILNDTYIITNGKDIIYKFISGTTLVALGGSPPTRAKTICVFQNRIVLGGTEESGTMKPQRIRWTSVGTIETWTGGTSGYVDLDTTIDWVMHIKLLKNKCIIYKDYSLWELTYVGGTKVFNPEIKVKNIGTSASNTIVDLGETHIFFAGSDIFSFDGIACTSISGNINPLLFQTEDKILNLSLIARANSLYLEELHTYLICFPPEAVLFKYNSKTRGWVRFNSRPIYAMGYYYAGEGRIIWANATGTWASATGSWKRRALSKNAPTTLLGWRGQIYEDNRATASTDELVWVTKDFIFGHAYRIPEVRTYYKGGAFALYYSVDGGLSYTSLGTHVNVSDWVEGVKPIDVTAQRIRFKITTSEPSFELKWLEPWYLLRKRSIDLRLS